jgi:hypothetical protein
VNESAKVVVFEDILGDAHNFDLHVLKVVHGGAEVEFFDVHGHELGTGGGDDTVEKELGSSEAGCLSADLARVVDVFTTDGEADTMWLHFLRSVKDNEA